MAAVRRREGQACVAVRRRDSARRPNSFDAIPEPQGWLLAAPRHQQRQGGAPPDPLVVVLAADALADRAIPLRRVARCTRSRFFAVGSLDREGAVARPLACSASGAA